MAENNALPISRFVYRDGFLTEKTDGTFTRDWSTAFELDFGHIQSYDYTGNPIGLPYDTTDSVRGFMTRIPISKAECEEIWRVTFPNEDSFNYFFDNEPENVKNAFWYQKDDKGNSIPSHYPKYPSIQMLNENGEDVTVYDSSMTYVQIPAWKDMNVSADATRRFFVHYRVSGVAGSDKTFQIWQKPQGRQSTHVVKANPMVQDGKRVELSDGGCLVILRPTWHQTLRWDDGETVESDSPYNGNWRVVYNSKDYTITGEGTEWNVTFNTYTSTPQIISMIFETDFSVQQTFSEYFEFERTWDEFKTEWTINEESVTETYASSIGGTRKAVIRCSLDAVIYKVDYNTGEYHFYEIRKNVVADEFESSAFEVNASGDIVSKTEEAVSKGIHSIRRTFTFHQKAAENIGSTFSGSGLHADKGDGVNYGNRLDFGWRENQTLNIVAGVGTETITWRDVDYPDATAKSTKNATVTLGTEGETFIQHVSGTTYKTTRNLAGNSARSMVIYQVIGGVHKNGAGDEKFTLVQAAQQYKDAYIILPNAWVEQGRIELNGGPAIIHLAPTQERIRTWDDETVESHTSDYTGDWVPIYDTDECFVGGSGKQLSVTVNPADQRRLISVTLQTTFGNQTFSDRVVIVQSYYEWRFAYRTGAVISSVEASSIGGTRKASVSFYVVRERHRISDEQTGTYAYYDENAKYASVSVSSSQFSVNASGTRKSKTETVTDKTYGVSLSYTFYQKAAKYVSSTFSGGGFSANKGDGVNYGNRLDFGWQADQKIYINLGTGTETITWQDVDNTSSYANSTKDATVTLGIGGDNFITRVSGNEYKTYKNEAGGSAKTMIIYPVIGGAVQDYAVYTLTQSAQGSKSTWAVFITPLYYSNPVEDNRLIVDYNVQAVQNISAEAYYIETRTYDDGTPIEGVRTKMDNSYVTAFVMATNDVSLSGGGSPWTLYINSINSTQQQKVYGVYFTATYNGGTGNALLDIVQDKSKYAKPEITRVSVPTIPASGGSVSSCTVYYTQIGVAGEQSATVSFTAVSADSLGTTKKESDFEVAKRTVTVTANGFTSDGYQISIMQGKNVVVSTANYNAFTQPCYKAKTEFQIVNFTSVGDIPASGGSSYGSGTGQVRTVYETSSYTRYEVHDVYTSGGHKHNGTYTPNSKEGYTNGTAPAGTGWINSANVTGSTVSATTKGTVTSIRTKVGDSTVTWSGVTASCEIYQAANERNTEYGTISATIDSTATMAATGGTRYVTVTRLYKEWYTATSKPSAWSTEYLSTATVYVMVGQIRYNATYNSQNHLYYVAIPTNVSTTTTGARDCRVYAYWGTTELSNSNWSFTQSGNTVVDTNIIKLYAPSGSTTFVVENNLGYAVTYRVTWYPAGSSTMQYYPTINGTRIENGTTSTPFGNAQQWTRWQLQVLANGVWTNISGNSGKP